MVVNSVVPDRPEIMVFAIPAAQDTYRGFLYEAIAISFNNTDMVEALKISAFGGKASTFAVLPDGRVVVNNGSEDMSGVHNILAMLDKSGDFSGADREALQQDFLAGVSGNMEVELGGRSYYLVYEPANFQNWTVVGIVPTDVVNASMNKLQSTTTLVVGGIVVVLAVMILVFVVLQNRQKCFLYAPALTERAYNHWATDNLIRRLYRGSAKNLVAALVHSESLTREDVEELRGFFRVEEDGPDA